MSGEEILALRAAQGWVSPLAPIERGDHVLMFSQRGTYEWLMHPDDTLLACLEGVEVDGLRLSCVVVDCHPLMNAFMVRAKDPGGNVRFQGGERKAA